MAFDTTIDRAAMLGEFSGDGEATYTTRAESGTNPVINAKTGATGVLHSVPLENSDGSPRDLSEWGDKVFVVERFTLRGDVQVVENEDITISGDDNEVFTIQLDSTTLAQPADFKWSLREESTGDVIASGRIAVAYSPIRDEE